MSLKNVDPRLHSVEERLSLAGLADRMAMRLARWMFDPG
jgi:hypothetical protein